MDMNVKKSSNGEYYRAYAEIDLDAIRKNVLTAKSLLPEKTGIVAVVKTDAYGHGAYEVAHAIRGLVSGYAVAALDEAVELRGAGIDAPVIILGYVSPVEYEELIRNDIIAAVYSYEQAKSLSDTAAALGMDAVCHIKADTGMNRIGFPAKNGDEIMDTADIIEKIKKLPNIKCDGIFTHFATADEEDKTDAKRQYSCFCGLIDELARRGINFTYRHCANSAAIMDMPDTALDLVRQGITLYGLKPSDEVGNDIALYPALSLKSHIVHIKTVLPGEKISYGGTYTADKMRVIATVSIGYGDGYPRQLSNKGYVLIHGHKAPIAGRICMDQMMIDITDIPGVEIEDTVTLIGRDGDMAITVEELGAMCGRFNYEFVCDINKRVKRIYTPNY